MFIAGTGVMSAASLFPVSWRVGDTKSDGIRDAFREFDSTRSRSSVPSRSTR
jgi:hypothetical protein